MSIRLDKKSHLISGGDAWDYIYTYEFLIQERRSLLNKTNELMEEVRRTSENKSLREVIDSLKKVEYP